MYVNCCGIYQVFLVLVIFCCDRVLGEKHICLISIACEYLLDNFMSGLH